MLTIELKRPQYVRWSTIQKKCHRLNDKLAFTARHPNGKVCRKEYRVNDKRHRDGTIGPADIYYNLYGKVVQAYYYNHGEFDMNNLSGLL